MHREFYELDERGRPKEYRNLELLHDRISPSVLRRRKADVETELPGSTDRDFFVSLSHRQLAAYQDHEIEVSRLVHLAKRRPLTNQQLGYAWHTGGVPQQRRRAEIRVFKSDPECRVFLSTDSGGVGLNLQNASVVINCDLPWNPAKLEQRIARAWRKNQTRPSRRGYVG
jgi:SNF2 family DNA or RNA helicase